MKTKREVLKQFAETSLCSNIDCIECAYKETCGISKGLSIKGRLQKIGAMAILRMFKEKKKPILEVGTKIRFDSGKLYTIEKRVDLYNREEYCLRDKNTMACYPVDYLIGKNWEIVE